MKISYNLGIWIDNISINVAAPQSELNIISFVIIPKVKFLAQITTWRFANLPSKYLMMDNIFTPQIHPTIYRSVGRNRSSWEAPERWNLLFQYFSHFTQMASSGAWALGGRRWRGASFGWQHTRVVGAGDAPLPLILVGKRPFFHRGRSD